MSSDCRRTSHPITQQVDRSIAAAVGDRNTTQALSPPNTDQLDIPNTTQAFGQLSHTNTGQVGHLTTATVGQS
jgi:hypothetical protein